MTHTPTETPERRHWAAIGERTSALGIRCLLLIYRLFGRMPFTIVLGPVLLFYWMSSAQLRRASLTWLAYVNDKTGFIGQKPGTREGLTHLMRFAETILDKFLAASGQLGFEAVRRHGDDAFLSDPPERGAVILTSHSGCQELLSATAGDATAHPIVILQHTKHAQAFNDMLRRAGLSPLRAEIVEVTAITPGTAMMLAGRVDEGAYIVIAGDRVPIGSNEAVAETTFFGHKADFPTGGALLALLFHCPLRMMVSTREGRAKGAPRYRVHFASLDEAPSVPRKERQAWLAAMAQRYATELETELARSPYDWFNFYDFWKTDDAEKTV